MKDVNTLYSLRGAKYNKNSFQNLQDLKETGEGLVMFKFKLGYIEKQLFVVVSVNSNKNGSFMVLLCLIDFHKINKSCIIGM